jgi:hypothetical protein
MRTILSVLLAAGGAAAAGAAEPAIGVDEIHAGQRGHGESVFVGSAPERFDVEVLGVLRDAAPGTSYILARLSGRDLERTGVVAGMSGSPVWIDGRLAGAVAFSWPFAEEAIAGITPIAAMRGVPAAKPWGSAPATPKVALGDLFARRLPADPLAPLALLAAAGEALGVRPGWTWSAAGFAPPTLARIAAALPAAAPAAGGRSDAGIETLAGGSSVAAVFVDGDLRLAATGTVTERDGDRVLAFGHSVAGLGEISLPLAPAEVVTVLDSGFSSFKIANSGPVAGVFELDHAAGVAGRLGVEAHTVPLVVTVAAPEPRTFRMHLARVPSFVPTLVAVGAFGALDSVTAAGGIEGIDLGLVVALASGERVALEQSFDGVGAAGRAVAFAFAVVDFLARTDLAPVELASVEVELVPHAEPRADLLVGAYPSARRVRPGEKIELVLELRGYRGEVERRSVPLVVPADLPAGRYPVLVGDAASLDGARFSLAPVEPRRLSQALELIASLGSTREIGVLGLAPEPAVAAGGQTLARLPPSVRALWAGAETATRPLRTSIVQRERFAAPRPLAGLQRVDLEIVRVEQSTGEAASDAAARAARRNGSRGGRER